jgi:hypothetical protein
MFSFRCCVVSFCVASFTLFVFVHSFPRAVCVGVTGKCALSEGGVGVGGGEGGMGCGGCLWLAGVLVWHQRFCSGI